ncbi:MAG: FixH family protein [Myxococcota bacterium]|nr:FixH family protein [Myxococcota bacterium]
MDLLMRPLAPAGGPRRARARGAMISLAAAALLAPPGLGCTAVPAQGNQGFSGQPFAALSSKGGAYQVSVRTSPQPPSRGQVSAEYTIVSTETRAPASGLSLTVVPWMPAMGHGASVVPSVAESSAGTYVVTDVDLFMPGHWVLRTTLSPAAAEAGTGDDAGLPTDYVEPSFEIP